jgi:hypothetical protein
MAHAILAISGDLRWPPRQQCRKPGPMFGAMDLGVADHRHDAGNQSGGQRRTNARELIEPLTRLVGSVPTLI